MGAVFVIGVLVTHYSFINRFSSVWVTLEKRTIEKYLKKKRRKQGQMLTMGG